MEVQRSHDLQGCAFSDTLRLIMFSCVCTLNPVYSSLFHNTKVFIAFLLQLGGHDRKNPPVKCCTIVVMIVCFPLTSSYRGLIEGRFPLRLASFSFAPNSPECARHSSGR